ncbi:MAG: VWA domain-containing protein [Cyanobacteriota bacterium]|nr:VWA domain-containing protein [Cyanobacteriota bacterium]
MANRDKLVYNRDVFFLIDRSASMLFPDAKTANKKRWDYLQETVFGHVDEILSEEDSEFGKIADEVTLYFFNRRGRPKESTIRDSQTVMSVFSEVRPNGSTFIADALQEAIEKWLGSRTENNQGAFIVIYTDGLLDDKDEFIKVIDQTCSKINSQDEVKILLIGLGSDVDNESAVDFYVGLDANTKGFRSRTGENCNILIFDLIDDVMDEGLIAAFERQLISDATKGLAYWIKERYPNVYNKYAQ